MSIPANVGLINIPHLLQLWLNETKVIWQISPQLNRMKENIHTKARDLMRHFPNHCRWALPKT